MGAATLKQYAKLNFGVELSLSDAEKWKWKWVDIFPEMRRYLADDKITRLASVIPIDNFPSKQREPDEETVAKILYRIAGGATSTTKGRSFSKDEIQWAWSVMGGMLADKPEFQADILAQRGSHELQRALVPRETVVVPTGRIRAGCAFGEAKNTPFQGLASDGAKLALYRLLKEGWRLAAFVHDEILVEVPEGSDYAALGARLKTIMEEEMRRVVPDVKVKCGNPVPMRRWAKDAELVHAGGVLVPWDG